MMLLGLMVLLGAWGYCSSLLSLETCRSHGRLAPRLELRFCRLVRATVAQGPRRDLNFAEIGSHQMLWGDLSDAPCMQMAIFTEAVFDCGHIVGKHERSLRQVLLCFSEQPRDTCQLGFVVLRADASPSSENYIGRRATPAACDLLKLKWACWLVACPFLQDSSRLTNVWLYSLG